MCVVHMYVCVHMYEGPCTHVCLWGGQRSTSHVILVLYILVFETEPLIDPELPN